MGPGRGSEGGSGSSQSGTRFVPISGRRRRRCRQRLTRQTLLLVSTLLGDAHRRAHFLELLETTVK